MEVLRGQQGYRWHQGASRVIGGVRGIGPSGVHLGAGRACRYSGAGRSIGGMRGLLGGVRGAFGGWQRV